MPTLKSKAGNLLSRPLGLFGGAVDLGESAETGLKRELYEELTIEISNADYFTEFTFDFSFRGLGQVLRRYYHVQ